MPVNIQYTTDEKGVILNQEGIVRDEELIDAVTSVFDDQRFLKLKYFIGDRTNVTSYKISTPGMNAIVSRAERASRLNPAMKIALVSPNPLVYGMSRMFVSLSFESSFEIEIFPDRESADIWIDKHIS